MSTDLWKTPEARQKAMARLAEFGLCPACGHPPGPRCAGIDPLDLIHTGVQTSGYAEAVAWSIDGAISSAADAVRAIGETSPLADREKGPRFVMAIARELGFYDGSDSEATGPLLAVMAEIGAEVDKQRLKYGPTHDDAHDENAWASIVINELAAAVFANPPNRFRVAMIKVSAVAFSAVTWWDRRLGSPTPTGASK